MKAFLVKYWKLLVLGVVVVLIFFLWKGCKPGPDHSGDKTTVDSVHVDLAAVVKSGQQRIAVLQRDSAEKEVEIDALIADKLNMQRDLNSRSQIVTQTIASGNRARAIHDTLLILSNCDSLREEVISDIPVIEGYQDLTDSLIGALSAQGIVKDSIAANWKYLFLKADSAESIENGKYNALYSDYLKDQRKIKFTNVLGKIGAGVIAALTIGLLIKK
jgi:hypothetical protein